MRTEWTPEQVAAVEATPYTHAGRQEIYRREMVARERCHREEWERLEALQRKRRNAKRST